MVWVVFLWLWFNCACSFSILRIHHQLLLLYLSMYTTNLRILIRSEFISSIDIVFQSCSVHEIVCTACSSCNVLDGCTSEIVDDIRFLLIQIHNCVMLC